MKSSVMSSVLLSILLLSASLLTCGLLRHNNDNDVNEIFRRRELPREIAPTEGQLIDGSGRFGFNLMQRVLDSDPEASHFISPLSITMAFGMLLNGAEGETREQIHSVLGIENMDRLIVSTYWLNYPEAVFYDRFFLINLI